MGLNNLHHCGNRCENNLCDNFWEVKELIAAMFIVGNIV